MSLRQSTYRFTIPCRSREYCRSQPLRNFHGSRPRHDLVAPPHPVSHFRPIIYGDASSQPPPTYLRHPYSLSEFTIGTGSALGDHELQFLLQRQQLDTFHHSFWLDSNTRFYTAKEAIIGSLPSTATARDKEVALSQFYKQWVLQERERTESYAKEWRRRNYDLILLEVRVQFHRLYSRLAAFFERKNKR
ncbi:hypothetical protein BYT27DRAFT_6916763 [Phlegmacium glaucopus]|nr:hypothetical protein BYT27DRAFT_6916763 [Phlegmacium glaucopus]